jgi:hypothetical protein
MAGMIRVARLSRLLDRFRPWDIVVDDKVVGDVANGDVVGVVVERGTHTLRVGHRWWGSPLLTFTVGDFETLEFACRPRPHPMVWLPYGMASLYRHDLFIVLGQVSIDGVRLMRLANGATAEAPEGPTESAVVLGKEDRLGLSTPTTSGAN